MRLRLSTTFALLSVALPGVISLAQDAGSSAGSQRQSQGSSGVSVDPALLAETKAKGSARAIVGLRLSWRQEGSLTAAARDEQRLVIARSQEALLEELQGTGARLLRNYASIPFQLLEVTPATLDRLMTSKSVLAIEPDRILAPTLAQSVPLVQADQAWTAGFDGTGIAVAILDSGVEASHSFFGGRVAAEACFSTNTTNVVSLCPNGLASQIGAGAAAPTACAGVDGCDHGTHVAGITAGAGASFSGVAKGASILGIQVFSRFTLAADCNGTAPCIRAFTSDIISGLEHVLSLNGTFQIAAVNMSLGGGSFASDAACDAANTATKAAVDNLRSVRIASVISSGNSGLTTAIGSPGCISTAVAVGSTTKLDAVSSFSNSSPMVELLAPGQDINSSVTANAFGLKSGTSMAAPHVTGAWAILRQQRPSATVTDVLDALSLSGLAITDARNGVTKPRIRIKNAMDPGLYIDSVSVTEGNTGTVNAIFTVRLSPATAGTVTVQYQTANGTATAGADYVSTSGTLTFLPGDAPKTVTVTVNGDTTEESNETFFVNLSAATGGVPIVDAQGVGTIVDNDAPSCSVVGVADGTFEAGSPWPAWTTQTSTSFGTPLCNTAGCGTGGGSASPFAGDNWAWFGGGTAVETGTLGQSLVLPVSTDLRLRFQMRIGAVAAPADDTFVVAIDGTPVQTFTEPVTAEAAYTQREINLTPFANGVSHSLLFTYNHPSAGTGNLTVDNVEVVNCQIAVPLPSLSINDVSVTEGDSGTKTATFTVSLSAASASTVTVNYSTADGSATADVTAGADYLAALGIVSFPPNTTSNTISVTIVGDTAVESNETFFVNLSNPSGATIDDAQGVGTIVNDDGPVGPSPGAFYTLSPCRIVDTRDAVGALGGPALQGSAQRTFELAGPKCAIPTTATALSINVTVTGPTAPGNLRIFPGGVGAPLVSTINFSPGQTRANNAVVQLGSGGKGSMSVLNDAAGTVHFIVDVNGYFQ